MAFCEKWEISASISAVNIIMVLLATGNTCNKNNYCDCEG